MTIIPIVTGALGTVTKRFVKGSEEIRSRVEFIQTTTLRTKPADPRLKLKESEKKAKYFDLAWELKTTVKIKMTIIQIVIGAFDEAPKGLFKGMGDLEIRERAGPSKLLYYSEQPEHLGDLRRRAVTQNLVKDQNADVKHSQRTNTYNNNSNNNNNNNNNNEFW